MSVSVYWGCQLSTNTQSSSLTHFKVCILVYINLTILFRVLLETTSFAYEPEKGTPIFLPGKSVLKKFSQCMWEFQGQKESCFFQLIPSRDVLPQRASQVILEKASGKNTLSPLAHGGNLLEPWRVKVSGFLGWRVLTVRRAPHLTWLDSTLPVSFILTLAEIK